MSKPEHPAAPVPPGNRPQSGPKGDDGAPLPDQAAPQTGGDAEQDAQRRLGGYSGKGEHPRQQPGKLNDG